MEQTNKHNLKNGDVITFMNARQFEIKMTVTRMTDKSCFVWNGQTEHRESWNSINTYIKKYNATIVRS